MFVTSPLRPTNAPHLSIDVLSRDLLIRVYKVYIRLLSVMVSLYIHDIETIEIVQHRFTNRIGLL